MPTFPESSARLMEKGWRALSCLLVCGIVFLTLPHGVASQSGGDVSAPSRGVLRKNPEFPYRLLKPDGSIFNGAGIQDCWDMHGTGSLVGGIGEAVVSMEEYLQIYAQAGFNLFRFNPGNCNRLGNVRDPQNAQTIERILRTAYDNGYYIMFTFFQSGAPDTATAKALVQYMMGRWGRYVDIWEISNEADERSLPTPQLVGHLP